MTKLKAKLWDKLNVQQKLYAERLGTNSENLTQRQYDILTKEKPEIWPNYQWHLNATTWNQPIN